MNKLEINVKRSLPVGLTKEERLNKSLELTQKMDDLAKVEFDAKIAKDQLKKKVDDLSGEINQIHRVVHSGFEPRMVDCEWKFNFSKMEKALIRIDTGEIVQTSSLTDSERQLAIEMEAKKEVAAE